MGDDESIRGEYYNGSYKSLYEYDPASAYGGGASSSDNKLDPYIVFRVPEDGDYEIKIEDSTKTDKNGNPYDHTSGFTYDMWISIDDRYVQDGDFKYTIEEDKDTPQTDDGDVNIQVVDGNILEGRYTNDILIGKRGVADELYGKSNDDTLIYDSSDSVIDGGENLSGNYDKDTLLLIENDSIDFSGSDTPIRNIEIINLKDGDHRLDNLSPDDVRLITDDDNKLTIKADSGDTINLTNQWTDKGNGLYEDSNDSSTQIQIEGSDYIVNTTSTVNDSIVIGMSYTTSSGQSGVTSHGGTFAYQDGDIVTFKVANITLGSIDTSNISDNQVFLQDIAGVDRSELNNQYVTNMAILLQSLDSDANANNGIDLSEDRLSKLDNLNINLETISTNDLIDRLQSVGIEPVSKEDALTHLKETLIEKTNLSESDFAPIEVKDTIDETLQEDKAQTNSEQESKIEQTDEQTNSEDTTNDSQAPVIMTDDTISMSALADDNSDNASQDIQNNSESVKLDDLLVDDSSNDDEIIIDIPSTENNENSDVAQDDSLISNDKLVDNNQVSDTDISTEIDSTVGVSIEDDYHTQSA